MLLLLKRMICMKKIVTYVLISVGLFIIGLAIYQQAVTVYNQKKLIEEYNKYVDTLKSMEASELTAEASNNNATDTESIIDTELNVAETPLSEEESEESKNTNVQEETPEDNKNQEPDLSKVFEGKQISGLIEIPNINVSAAILEGTDDSALKYAVGHYPGLGEIGQPGNYVLLGHRNYIYGHFFRNLDRLNVGDKVNITVGDKIYTYEVYESFIVKPEEVWVLEQTEESIITMISCTPMGTYTDRLIVRGTLLN
jgi:sortase A